MMKTKYHLSIFLIALFAGLMGFTTDAAAKKYLEIGGVQVTSDNYTNISASGGFPAVKSGTVTFDTASYTLTLNNATIEGNLYLTDGSKSYTIVLQGNNTLKKHNTSIYCFSSLRITGGGSLNIKAYNAAIIVIHDLTIDGCTLTANRRILVDGSLQINNSNVYVNNPNELKDGYAFYILQGITLSGCKITRPAGAKIKKMRGLNGFYYSVVDASGDMAPIVHISTGSEPEQPAKFTLDPKELTLDAWGNGQQVTLSCDKEYHVNGYEKPDWLLASGGSVDDKKSQQLYIYAKENTGPERTGEITIQTSEGNVTLKVTQRGASSTPSGTLTLDPMVLTMKYHRNEAEVTLACSD
ncbi:hypothetical protein BHU11_10625, partial [Tannerella sp. oral taxon 808]